MKKILISLPPFLSILLTSCETTGDPNQGGYFGWSETKAAQRQDALRSELSVLQDEGAQRKKTRSSLQSQRSSLKKQIASAQAKAATASTPAEQATANAEVSRLNKQLRLLESL